MAVVRITLDLRAGDDPDARTLAMAREITRYVAKYREPQPVTLVEVSKQVVNWQRIQLPASTEDLLRNAG